MTPVLAGPRLAIDVGSVRIGVAASLADVAIAVPVTTIARGDGDIAALAALAALARERGATQILVGLPTRLDGTPGPAADAATEFARALAALVSPLPVAMVDERLTTKAAQRGLHEAGRTVRSSRSMIDEQAAVVLLEDALALERSTGRSAGTPVEPA